MPWKIQHIKIQEKDVPYTIDQMVLHPTFRSCVALILLATVISVAWYKKALTCVY